MKLRLTRASAAALLVSKQRPTVVHAVSTHKVASSGRPGSTRVKNLDQEALGDSDEDPAYREENSGESDEGKESDPGVDFVRHDGTMCSGVAAKIGKHGYGYDDDQSIRDCEARCLANSGSCASFDYVFAEQEFDLSQGELVHANVKIPKRRCYYRAAVGLVSQTNARNCFTLKGAVTDKVLGLLQKTDSATDHLLHHQQELQGGEVESVFARENVERKKKEEQKLRQEKEKAAARKFSAKEVRSRQWHEDHDSAEDLKRVRHMVDEDSENDKDHDHEEHDSAEDTKRVRHMVDEDSENDKDHSSSDEAAHEFVATKEANKGAKTAKTSSANKKEDQSEEEESSSDDGEQKLKQAHAEQLEVKKSSVALLQDQDEEENIKPSHDQHVDQKASKVAAKKKTTTSSAHTTKTVAAHVEKKVLPSEAKTKVKKTAAATATTQKTKTPAAAGSHHDVETAAGTKKSDESRSANKKLSTPVAATHKHTTSTSTAQHAVADGAEVKTGAAATSSKKKTSVKTMEASEHDTKKTTTAAAAKEVKLPGSGATEASSNKKAKGTAAPSSTTTSKAGAGAKRTVVSAATTSSSVTASSKKSKATSAARPSTTKKAPATAAASKPPPTGAKMKGMKKKDIALMQMSEAERLRNTALENMSVEERREVAEEAYRNEGREEMGDMLTEAEMELREFNLRDHSAGTSSNPQTDQDEGNEGGVPETAAEREEEKMQAAEEKEAAKVQKAKELQEEKRRRYIRESGLEIEIAKSTSSGSKAKAGGGAGHKTMEVDEEAEDGEAPTLLLESTRKQEEGQTGEQEEATEFGESGLAKTVMTVEQLDKLIAEKEKREKEEADRDEGERHHGGVDAALAVENAEDDEEESSEDEGKNEEAEDMAREARKQEKPKRAKTKAAASEEDVDTGDDKLSLAQLSKRATESASTADKQLALAQTERTARTSLPSATCAPELDMVQEGLSAGMQYMFDDSAGTEAMLGAIRQALWKPDGAIITAAGGPTQTAFQMCECANADTVTNSTFKIGTTDNWLDASNSDTKYATDNSIANYGEYCKAWEDQRNVNKADFGTGTAGTNTRCNGYYGLDHWCAESWCYMKKAGETGDGAGNFQGKGEIWIANILSASGPLGIFVMRGCCKYLHYKI
ncbi:unnamed protein product [Amoebophrya sp. A120]|nr:unnamed protein product [Amoebophrya sp. A120]|eukprot:GSA120T00000577001.1